MLLLYRLLLWSVIAFGAANTVGLLHVPLGETTHTWAGQLWYYLFGYILFEILWFLNRQWKLGASPHIFLWLVATFIHNVPGEVYGLFTRYSWYDQSAHFLFMGCLLGFVVQDVTKTLFQSEPRLLRLAIVCAFTVTLGVVNEVFEYLLGLGSIEKISATMVGDTANDLLMNSLGTTVFALVSLVSSVSQKQAS